MDQNQLHTALSADQTSGCSACLPEPLSGPLSEFGTETPGFFHVFLDENDVVAIEIALASFKALGVEGQEISKENFSLPPELQERLIHAALEIHQGNGLCQIHGLNPTRYSDADNLLLFLGLSSYIGDKRGVQDKKGNVISHITDAKTWSIPYEKRHSVHTNQSLAWHCDMGADILALQYRQVAAHGGATMVSSFCRVYNDLLAEHPEIIAILAKPNWPVHVTDRKSRHILTSLIAFHENRLMVNFDPSRLGAHPDMAASRSRRTRNIPALTDEQRHALGVVSEMAQKHAVKLDASPGDMLFINNWAHLHARTSYKDSGDEAEMATDQRRHLLRLWLRSSQFGWGVPDSLRRPWEAAFGYTDEGYVSGDHESLLAQLKYPVMPAPEYTPAKYTNGSAAFVLSDSESEEEEEEEADDK